MVIRVVVRSAVLGVALLLAAGGVCAQDSRPNIIVIATDDLRADAIGAYGHPFSQTPNLDQLAAAGVRFDRSYASTPLCSPWRASFLTGQYMSANGWTGNDQYVGQTTVNANPPSNKAARVPNLDDATMWHELLQDAGYRTGYVGKYHLDTGNGTSTFNRGGTPRPGWDYWAGFRTAQGTHRNIQLNVNGVNVNETGYTSDTVATYANNFLASGASGEPFALVVSYKAVHAPQDNPDDVSPANRSLYSTAQVQAHLNTFQQNTYSEAVLDANKPILSRTGGPANGNPIPGQTGPGNASILGQLRLLKDMDDSIGRILTQLETMGLMENTLIAFTSDSGLGWREHGLGGKSLPYEFSARTPLIMYHPALAAGGQAPQHLVTQLDLAATVLDAAGVEKPSTMQGTSVLPYLDGSGAAGRDVLYLENYYDGFSTVTNSWQAVIDDRYKYIRYNDYKNVDELYDMQADPHEIYNVINSPAHAAALKRLRREVQLGHGAAISPGETRPVHAVPTSFNDFTLNENNGVINNTGSGQTNRVGAQPNQGGGRNVFFMFELPTLAPGERIAEASFQFLLTHKAGSLPANLGGDLWAIGIFANDAQSHAQGNFLESETDPNPNHVKIADDLLKPSTTINQIVRTDSTASTAFTTLLNDFYDGQPGYDGGSYLFLRLNPDMDLGLNSIGWDLTPVENISHGGDPLMLFTVEPAPEPSADFDSDGDVDGADFLTWQRNVSKTSGATQADGNANPAEDGDVDADDLAVWKAQFGASGVAATHQVPEPNTIGLAAMLVAFLFRCNSVRAARI